MTNALTASEEMKVIVFRIEKEEYAIPVQFIQSIERMLPITRIPNADSFVKGVMNLRGVITPVIDLRLRFGLDEKEVDDTTRILVISKDQLDFGLIVDEAKDVFDFPKHKIEPTPEVIGSVEAEYLNGVIKLGDKLFTLLKLEKIIDNELII
ncbi:chemotaxis protein CheW [Alkalihalobacillus alcalophilus ATCC 27647 = CGMCC 1.3604]|uniref:Chemotaxis protein CheW n=1 Tax=Alkalihalobacillus alcalophilus ATCC 27647 = CGMCC 1.3604 TaxID=1218173 RepID=A0A094WN11_ALKAL|nr:chemotaxis protein CheW [Alkalihalobacillus alcalophilus]KGA97348.1 chemotaxis protein CheW [Alkalihalobacillus alcalophilus ATCC 27647 = CGMCC 1.3604]MED1560915.1 chemotaxis protein CheW [Alkalihalobacillus alcalophilus]THG90385.1 chemotaxis protein CheW [Alkalihalobacillus alcalophilus ATCC 27647 = CGMCC 1.3604]